jgi:hypothetical protein
MRAGFKATERGVLIPATAVELYRRWGWRQRGEPSCGFVRMLPPKRKAGQSIDNSVSRETSVPT